MNHLMIDLETMGNKPAAPIVAIGAVFFAPKSSELGAEFYMAVNLASAMDQGRHLTVTLSCGGSNNHQRPAQLFVLTIPEALHLLSLS